MFFLLEFAAEDETERLLGNPPPTPQLHSPRVPDGDSTGKEVIIHKMGRDDNSFRSIAQKIVGGELSIGETEIETCHDERVEHPFQQIKKTPAWSTDSGG